MMGSPFVSATALLVALTLASAARAEDRPFLSFPGIPLDREASYSLRIETEVMGSDDADVVKSAVVVDEVRVTCRSVDGADPATADPIFRIDVACSGVRVDPPPDGVMLAKAFAFSVELGRDGVGAPELDNDSTALPEKSKRFLSRLGRDIVDGLVLSWPTCGYVELGVGSRWRPWVAQPRNPVDIELMSVDGVGPANVGDLKLQWRRLAPADSFEGTARLGGDGFLSELRTRMIHPGPDRKMRRDVTLERRLAARGGSRNRPIATPLAWAKTQF